MITNAKKVLAALAVTFSVGAALIGFVEKEEGFGPKNAQGLYMAYPDAGYSWQLPTICNGHTRGVKRGDTATIEQCRKYLADDLEIAAKDVRRCVKVQITESQFNALTSFNFNTGALCTSQLVMYLNRGMCYTAATEFNASPVRDKTTGAIKTYKGKPVMKWTTSNGTPLNGLIKRRAKEREMFEKDCK